MYERLLAPEVVTWSQVIGTCTAVVRGCASRLRATADVFMPRDAATAEAETEPPSHSEPVATHTRVPPPTPPSRRYPEGRRFPAELSFAVQPNDPSGSCRNTMYWAIHQQPPTATVLHTHVASTHACVGSSATAGIATASARSGHTSGYSANARRVADGLGAREWVDCGGGYPQQGGVHQAVGDGVQPPALAGSGRAGATE